MTMVRVDDELHGTLKALAHDEGRSIGMVLQAAVESYQREKFWANVHADYARLQADPEAWASYRQDIDAWDSLASDGLEGEAPFELGGEGDAGDHATATSTTRGR